MKASFLAAVVFIVIAVVGASGADAAVQTIALDESGAISPNGRALTVTGSIECDAGDRARITVNPMSSPNALGRAAVVCTGDVQPFEVTVRMRGNGTRFSELSMVQLFVGADAGSGFLSTTETVSW